MPARALRPLAGPLAVALLLAVVGCTDDDATPSAGPASPRPAVTADVTLPPDPLVALVPGSGDVPAGLLPVLSGSGPRDLAAVAAFSADAAAAADALRAHGFRRAYVAQYAEPGTAGRVLSVVVAEFATADGAADDLAGDVAAGGTSQPADVGQSGAVAEQPLPGGSGTLTTLRFRVGTRTWLLAYGAPADSRDARDVVLDLGRALAERAAPA